MVIVFHHEDTKNPERKSGFALCCEDSAVVWFALPVEGIFFPMAAKLITTEDSRRLLPKAF
ncbi:MAG TPA: hypothetical protein VGK99_20030 [Acidobacteriota bacterium]|jgi:hypothetical protein